MSDFYQCSNCLEEFTKWEMELEPVWECYACLDDHPDSAENYKKEKEKLSDDNAD